MVNLKNKNVEISLHFLIWLVLFFLPAAFSVGSNADWKDLFRHFWIQLIFLAVVFYANYTYLVKYLFEDKKVWFFVVNLTLILTLIYFKNQISDWLEPNRHRPSDRRPPVALFYFMDTLIYMIPVAFSIAINAGKKIQKAEEMKIEADNIKLQSELQHLKYQLQPHFFFNSLNNIYSLIDFAPDKAKQSIHSLSKLMRHLLYKTDVPTISLSEEVEFLNKYIELMSLRLTDNTKVYTNFPKTIPEMKIAPLLFISIVENAFKHGISATQHSDIHFKMEIIEKEIYFTASNSNFPKTDADKSGSGIGVENLKKRLNLLYPEKHEFHSHLNNGMYIAEVKLDTK
ncbi:two-component sensor histidine kinase [Chryseobacterium ginsenosidimutans]|jgi:two-component sensor histidine kinase|uniref:sensor histidine kinase n=1 Tax=Chryseobacterium ginsenosidimutans TaxID=687846 RepID=UPI0021672034|nr:histidine kinase [Chryseobacterium ginsenosidimutans]MCS3870914.1 two-component sensor histidine kinase [Chryseobacterium ginsenosidimutans]